MDDVEWTARNAQDSRGGPAARRKDLTEALGRGSRAEKRRLSRVSLGAVGSQLRREAVPVF